MKSVFTTIVENLGYTPTEASGIPETEIEEWEARTGVAIPAMLREYLRTVGNMAFNRSHNRLYNLEELRLEDSKLVFMEESENVVQWAVDTEDTDADPIVFQRETGEDEDLWYPEEEPCSAFLALMIYWQTVNGGFEFFAMGDAPESVVKKIAKAWERKASGSGVTCFARKGAVLCVVEGEEDDNIMLAALTEADLQQAIMDLQDVGLGAVNMP